MEQERLELPRNEFVAALDLLRRTATRFENDEAVISFDGACLHIELGGATTLVPAKGRLDGQLRTRAEALFLWADKPPPGDPSVFEFEGAKMIFGRCSTTVHRQPAWSKLVEVPVNITKMEILALPGKYSRKELEQAGLWDSIEDARCELWNVFERSYKEYEEIGLKTNDLFDCLLEGIEKKYGPLLIFD